MAKKIILFMLLIACTSAWCADGKQITVQLTVPDLTWSIVIHEVYRVGNELWIISIVSKNPDVMGAQVISTVQSSLKMAVPDLPMKNFIIGKTWGWENEEQYAFIKDLSQIENELKSGELLYKAGQKQLMHE